MKVLLLHFWRRSENGESRNWIYAEPIVGAALVDDDQIPDLPSKLRELATGFIYYILDRQLALSDPLEFDKAVFGQEYEPGPEPEWYGERFYNILQTPESLQKAADFLGIPIVATIEPAFRWSQSSREEVLTHQEPDYKGDFYNPDEPLKHIGRFERKVSVK